MTLQIAIVIYPGFTALDAIGPHHVLAHTPAPTSPSSPHKQDRSPTSDTSP